MLEGVRVKLRDLVKFIDKSERRIVYTDFADQIGPGTLISLGGITAAFDTTAYKKKVEQFIDRHRTHTTIHKLRNDEPLTPTDLAELERLLFSAPDIGSREQFERAYGKTESLGLFLRQMVGLDREAAKRAFGVYLDGSKYNPEQVRFINFIINQLTSSGVMPPERLYEQPFTDFGPTGVDGVFSDDDVVRIITLLKDINDRATITRTG
jgi:type I restriction enzyme R subunit